MKIVDLSMLKAGFHIIVRSPKTIADSLGESASVSRLTCFHIVIRNRKESSKICKEGNDSESSKPLELC